MGEQRMRRINKQPTVNLIDTLRSRGQSNNLQVQHRRSRIENNHKSEKKRIIKSIRTRHHKHKKTRKKRHSISSVNPIFVWTRQENNYIVDVKCEDYDKRNRILLTKTAHGWKAIPRTKTLLPALQEENECSRRKKHKKSKIKKKSVSVQVDEVFTNETKMDEDADSNRNSLPKWTVDDNKEDAMNNTVDEDDKNIIMSQEIESTNENLNENSEGAIQQNQCDCNTNSCNVTSSSDVTQLDSLLKVAKIELYNIQIARPKESETVEDLQDNASNDEINTLEHVKTEEENPLQLTGEKVDYNCGDYNDEENNIFMDDILSKLEKSLESPEEANYELLKATVEENREIPKVSSPTIETNMQINDEINDYDTKNDESSTGDYESVLNLSRNSKENTISSDLKPEDLSMSKNKHEVLQGKQQKEIFTENLQNSDINNVTSTLCSDEFNFTCQDQHDLLSSPRFIEKNNNIEPLELVKCKLLKTKSNPHQQPLQNKSTGKRISETHFSPKESTPINQLEHLLKNPNLNIPDPVLVPKERLASIISFPGEELPRLLMERPELRLPQALAYPHLLQNPDILVITLSQLKTIIEKQSNCTETLKYEERTKKYAFNRSKQVKCTLKTSQDTNPELEKSQEKFCYNCNNLNKNHQRIESNQMQKKITSNFTSVPYYNDFEISSSFDNNMQLENVLKNTLPYQTNVSPDLITNDFLLNGNLHQVSNDNQNKMLMWQKTMLQASVFQQMNRYKDKSSKSTRKNYNNFNKPHTQNWQSTANQNPSLRRPNLYNAPTKSFVSDNLPPNFNPECIFFPNYNISYDNYFNSLLNINNFHCKNSCGNGKEGACKSNSEKSRKPESSKMNKFKEDKKDPQDGVSSTYFDIKRKLDMQPIDLSYKHTSSFDEIPEVGSTTSKGDEIPETQKPLWHPLFGM